MGQKLTVIKIKEHQRMDLQLHWSIHFQLYEALEHPLFLWEETRTPPHLQFFSQIHKAQEIEYLLSVFQLSPVEKKTKHKQQVKKCVNNKVTDKFLATQPT